MLKIYRNIAVLSIAQIFGMTGAISFTLLGGLVSMTLAPSKDWITLPIAILVIGAAIAAIPSAMIMRRIGRKAGHLSGASVALLGAAIAAIAIAQHSFALFCLAALFIGFNSAFVQQYRFAVIEGLPSKFTAKAVSILLFGNIISAYLGTELTNLARHWFTTLYLGSFIVLIIMLSLSWLALCFYRNQGHEQRTKHKAQHTIIEANFLPAMIIAALSYFVMSLIMVGTPIAMHVLHHFTMNKTTIVMQSHLIAMYLPSLFVGYLAGRLGNLYVSFIGIICLILCIIINFTGFTFTHYLVALMLLGVGWNFSFICATTILTESYLPQARFKMQAINDFFVFGVNAIASLSSGSLVLHIGWSAVNGIAAFFIVIMLIATVCICRNQRQTEKAQPCN
jgi:MFS family permease